MDEVPLKKIQRGGGGQHYILISKEAMRKLRLRAQDENCKMVELVDVANKRLIFQRVF